MASIRIGKLVSETLGKFLGVWGPLLVVGVVGNSPVDCPDSSAGYPVVDFRVDTAFLIHFRSWQMGRIGTVRELDIAGAIPPG